MKIGDTVRLAECFHGIRWVKVGEVVEMTNTRARVHWNRWEYPSGHVKQDNKRTWVAIKRLS